MKTSHLALLLVFAIESNAQNSFPASLKSIPVSLFNDCPVNTNLYERDFALSPTGDELFYTLQSPYDRSQTIIRLAKDERGQWGRPEVAPFAGIYNSLEPAFTPGGDRLYFSSDRPLSGNAPKDFDIWYVEKKQGKWGDPVNAGPIINSNVNEFYPSATSSGNLYFTAERKNGVGLEDIYLARFSKGKFEDPVPLDSAVNSNTYEFNAWVSPDEQFIIFTSFGREDDGGGGDLYMSKKNEKGNWQRAKNLSFLNSDKLDFCPFVSFDRKRLFFTSQRSDSRPTKSHNHTYEGLLHDYGGIYNGGGNIFCVSFDEVCRNFEKL